MAYSSASGNRHADSARRRIERAWQLALVVATAWFYLATAQNEHSDWKFGEGQNDYYNLLLRGFLRGQLSMDVPVAPELLKATNPYDPAQRPPGTALHDASLFQGRYYLYFGPAPVVVLLLPFRVLTGLELPMGAAVFVFTYAGFLMSVGIWISIRLRYFPESSCALMCLGVVGLATVSMGPILLRRSGIWELSLSSGYFFAMTALACLFRHLHGPRGGTVWLIFASLALGLAAASRPVYIFAAGSLLIPLLQSWRREKTAGPGLSLRWRRTAVAGVAPIAVVGLAMAWYNLARFGDPTEFGVKYQLSGVFEQQARNFSPSYFPTNLTLYLIQPAEWLRYFPFMRAAAPPTRPLGYIGFEECFGVLTHLPMLWLAIFILLDAHPERPRNRGPLLAWITAAVALATGPALLICLFYAAMARYIIDFLPVAVLVALVGALFIEGALAGRNARRRRIALLFVSCVILISAAVATLWNFRLYDLFRIQNPATFTRIARVLNWPAHLIERVTGTSHGPLELDLKLPERSPGVREPLLTSGTFGARDRIFIQYENQGRIRLGFSRDDSVVFLSRELSRDASCIQRLRIEAGFLHPPPEHPVVANRETEDLLRMTRRLRIEFNGEVVIEEAQAFHPTSPAALFVGRDAEPRFFDSDFSGEVVAIRREDFTIAPPETGLRLRLRFPRAATGPAPLFTTESQGKALVWFYESTNSGHIRLGFATAEGAYWRSELITAPSEKVHELVWQSLSPPLTRARSPRRTLIRLNGWVVATAPIFCALAVAPENIGRADTAVPGIPREFPGKIFGSERLAGLNLDASGPFQALKIEVRLPTGREGAAEPLVVAGEPGRGDFLFVEYLKGNRIRFGLDHWGKAPVYSEPVTLDLSAVHTFEISLESFVQFSTRPPERIRIVVNGRNVWEQAVKLYPIRPGELSVGRNTLGGTACETTFTGEILRVERISG